MRGLVLVIALAARATLAVAQEPAPSQDDRPPARPAQTEQVPAADTGPDSPPAQRPSETRPEGRPQAPDTAPPAAEAKVDPPAPAQPEKPEKPEKPRGPALRETLRESDFDYAACLLALHDLGTEYQELPPIQEAGQYDCGIARPIQVSQIMPGITLQGGAPMRCDAARALGFWVRDFVRPAAARLPGAPRLTGMQLGTTYDCRGRVGTAETAKLSEHAFGNAIDIAAFTFQGSDPIPVEPRQDSGDLIESFQRAVRGSACLFFTTVLGPGSNAAHDDHLHLDIAARNGGWRLCQ